MPETTNKTAMQILRDRLLERIKSDSCSEYEENILNEITHSINTELLAVEKQQRKDDILIGYNNAGELPIEEIFNQTFNTK